MPELQPNHNLTVVERFEKAAGKFPSTIGDAILIDCNTINHLFPTSVADLAAVFPSLGSNKQKNPLPPLPDFCKYAMTVNGQLTD